MAAYNEIKPFTISIPDSELDQLHQKLELTRLPDELDLPPGQEWNWGIPLAVLKPVLEYWRIKYDWRAVEERINQSLPQFTTYVESKRHGEQEVHFVHKRSKNPGAIPLIFVSKIIEELVNPKDPKLPSFHVVAPSLPGYVFSQRANTPGMNVIGTAYVFDKLMQKLGYKHYVAQGGDWGALVCQAFAIYHQDTCLAIHTNFSVSFPRPLKNPILTLKTILGLYPKDERDGLKKSQQSDAETGYQKIQGTRPQTLAVGLTDSPVGLLAWIGEKLYAWTDDYPWTPEEWITWTMLYWVNGPAASLRYYKENSIVEPSKDPELQEELSKMRTLSSPTLFGFSWFPKDLYTFPVEWAGIGRNYVYSNKHNRGGHFAAWEVPELLVGDIQSFVTLALDKETRLLNAS
ncbi:epoxide hydrolase [Rhizoctonia solani]|uniref:Epoxide hydrolase n=1 Tax=Rhizoctonia solani TaxID=456999 RepID=A0A8H7HHS0_9AGAM|nr:epoxide hydrolase [Rhizoctonia solani]